MKMLLRCALLLSLVCGSAFAQRLPGQQSKYDPDRQLGNSYSPVLNAAGGQSSDHYLSTWVSYDWSEPEGGSYITWGEGTDPDNNFDWLWFNYYQESSFEGMDIGVGRTSTTALAPHVWELSTEDYNGYQSPGYNQTLDFTFKESLNPDQFATWWMGPKTIVYSQPEWNLKQNPGLGGEYECYIVNASNLTHQELAERFGLNRVGGEFFGQHYYHHYVTTRDSEVEGGRINQIWTIREQYSTDGPTGITKDSVPVNQIQGAWMQMGLVPYNFYNLGWKINIEFAGHFPAGSNPGFGLFTDIRLPAN